MTSNRTFRPLVTTLCVLATGLAGCGGGGGGSGEVSGVGAAEVSIQASPRGLDTGDRTTIEIQIDDVREDGIQLKVRYSNSLEYIEDSARLTLDDESVDINPGTDIDIDGFHYLVFYLTRDTFGRDNQGRLMLELEAADTGEDVRVAVDADVNADEEFDPDDPQFATQADVKIEIDG